MIPYKDLCTAIERFRVRRGAENGHAGRVATLATNGSVGAAAHVEGEGAAESADATHAVAAGEPDGGEDQGFPEVSGARVEVHARDDGRKPLSSETNEIDLAGAEMLGDDE